MRPRRNPTPGRDGAPDERALVWRALAARVWAARALTAVLAGALALAGCGITLPAPAAGTSGSTGMTGATRAAGTRARPAPVDNEVPTPPGKTEHAPGAATPAAAVNAFARAYINWTAADVATRMRALAQASVGQARTELQLEAAQTRADTQLHSGGIANSGVVEAVAPLGSDGGTSAGSGSGRGATDTARDAQYVVVTLERTTASASSAYEGLAPAWHVALATVRRTAPGRRWVVSGWQPES
jgi:hypothetical protein